jgi:hypothetical protein
MIVKIRLTADSEEECTAAIAALDAALSGRYDSEIPRAGTNPKYSDHQKWFAYGTLTLYEVQPAPRRMPRRKKAEGFYE